MGKYYVYILRSEIRDITYVGRTNNLERRLKEHNSGKLRFTSKFRRWKIFYSEELISEEEAIAKEKYFKTFAGRRRIKVLLK